MNKEEQYSANNNNGNKGTASEKLIRMKATEIAIPFRTKGRRRAKKNVKSNGQVNSTLFIRKFVGMEEKAAEYKVVDIYFVHFFRQILGIVFFL